MRHNNAGGVTAGQVPHNSSNVRVVTAGQAPHNSSTVNNTTNTCAHSADDVFIHCPLQVKMNISYTWINRWPSA